MSREERFLRSIHDSLAELQKPHSPISTYHIEYQDILDAVEILASHLMVDGYDDVPAPWGQASVDS